MNILQTSQFCKKLVFSKLSFVQKRNFFGLPSGPEFKMGTKVNQVPFLPPQKEIVKGKKTMVLDLDETLVCASIMNASSKVEMVDVKVKDALFKTGLRPFVHDFLKRSSELYEIIAFTAGIESVSFKQ